MSAKMWQDPKDFVTEWALEQPISAVDPAEDGYLRFAVACQASLLYSAPHVEGVSKRSMYAYVRRALRVFSSNIKDLGIIETTKRYKRCANLFYRALKKSQTGNIVFDIPNELADTPIFEVLKLLDQHMSKHETFPARGVKWVGTFLLFLSKIPLTRPDLEEPAVKAWRDHQEKVGLTHIDLRFTEALRSIVALIYEGDGLPSHGRHGPGITNERHKTIAEKNDIGYYPSIQTLELEATHPTQQSYVPQAQPDDSLYLVVPKDVGAVRSITAESAAMQRAQQKLKRLIYRTIDSKDSVLPISRYVRFSDQRQAQLRAVRGTRRASDSCPATTDLEKASDSVSIDLVVEVFKDNLLHELMCGRSWNALVNDEKFEVRMFAGMGSALTFPVQTILFTAVSVLATIMGLHKKEMGSYPEFPKDVLYEYLDSDGFFFERYKKYADAIQVYGDDISTPELAVAPLFHVLKHIGLYVNDEKSFNGLLAVRESCGIFACKGQDITPLRFRIPTTKSKGKLDYAAYEGLRSLHNFSYHNQYWKLYRILKSMAMDAPKLIGSKEMRKKFAQPVYEDYGVVNSKGVRVKVERYGKQPLGIPFILHEEYRGDDIYIGFISSRSSETTHNVVAASVYKACTTYGIETESDPDETQDYYHLNESLYKGSLRQIRDELKEPELHRKMTAAPAELIASGYATLLSLNSHGNVPRGIRLKKKNAIVSHMGDQIHMAWA